MDKFKKPYPNLNIDDYTHLYELDGRFKCSQCEKSRKFFCYSCSRENPENSKKKKPPKVKLPFEINIIKHKQEVDGKSTSSHAKILTENEVEIFIYPNIPDYRKEIDDVVLIFVSPQAVDVKSLLEGHKKFKLKDNYGLPQGELMGTLLKKDLNEIKDDNAEMPKNRHEEKSLFLEKLPFKKALFIDSTWKQCRSIFRDERLNSLTAVIIQHRRTIFWRKQPGNPSWYLSTIEAIHQFLIEVHIHAWGIEKNYFDNCLQDFRYYNLDWIPKEKIIDSNLDISEKREKEKVPYNGQYDNILYFYSFFYSLIHSLDNPNAEFKSIRSTD